MDNTGDKTGDNTGDKTGDQTGDQTGDNTEALAESGRATNPQTGYVLGPMPESGLGLGPPLALELNGIVRRYRQPGHALEVLRGADLLLAPGEMVALVGPSGSGKSTLLHVAGLLERPDAGRVIFAGRDCERLSEPERTAIRRDGIGFVYQAHHLLPEFSALENVMVPQLIAGTGRVAARARARDLLAMVGIADRETHRPARLSGGECQRVAIVRAIANAPQVVLADEPTGNLDPGTAEDVFGHLRRIATATGVSALIATHNPDLARRLDRIVELRDGLLLPAEMPG